MLSPSVDTGANVNAVVATRASAMPFLKFAMFLIPPNKRIELLVSCNTFSLACKSDRPPSPTGHVFADDVSDASSDTKTPVAAEFFVGPLSAYREQKGDDP